MTQEVPEELEIVAALVAREREIEAHLVEARGQAEALVEAARAQAQSLVQEACEERERRVEAARQDCAEERRGRADRRLGRLHDLATRLDGLDGPRMRELGNRVLQEIFPELDDRGRGRSSDA